MEVQSEFEASLRVLRAELESQEESAAKLQKDSYQMSTEISELKSELEALKAENSWDKHFPVSHHSQITIERILSSLPCVDRHAETLAGNARSLLQNISGEFSRLPLDRILCHGAHHQAKHLAD